MVTTVSNIIHKACKRFFDASERGFTFIELVIVILILGVFVTVATRAIDTTIDASRQAQAEDELNRLSNAIVGNSQLASGGMRTDFGYVGDIGALPISLDYLSSNPAGYSSWNGPYIRDNFLENTADFKTDPWGTNYAYSAGVTIQSTGSGSNITKQFANSTSAILSTPLKGVLLDRDGAPPGTDASNVNVTVTYPDGAGGTTSTTVTPNSSGSFSFTGIPIGNHGITAVYTTANDTAVTYASSLPRVGAYAGIMRLSNGYWADTTSGGGGGPNSQILRPIGVGSLSQLLTENCTVNWSCVKDVVSDDAGSFVKGGGGSFFLYDSYDTQNSSVSSGIIDSVVFFVHGFGSDPQSLAVFLKTEGFYYIGVAFSPTTTWTTYSTRTTVNPKTGSPWTWTQVNALEIGVAIKKGTQCTQVWVEVFYQ